jgi:hypothetical protein
MDVMKYCGLGSFGGLKWLAGEAESYGHHRIHMQCHSTIRPHRIPGE